jgi:hypothetical protein
MMTQTRTWTVLPALIAATGLILPTPFAAASAKGRKNTAIGLGAVAVQQLLTGKTTNGVLLGAGAAYAYKRYQDARKSEDRNRRTASDSTRYRGRYGGASVPVRRIAMTGRVTDDSGPTDRKLTVTANGREYRMDVPSDAKITHASDTLSVHDLKEGDLVRVVAYQAGDDRPQAWSVDVLRAAR